MSNGLAHVSISTPAGVYEIIPVVDDIYALLKVDSKAEDNGLCMVGTVGEVDSQMMTHNDSTETEKIKSNERFVTPCGTQDNPRVLVLYTSAALNYAGSVWAVENAAKNAVAQFNSAIYNSHINNQATLSLVGVQPLGFTETTGMGTDVPLLKTSIAAQSLRDAYLADIVILLTNGSLYGSRGAVGYTSSDVTPNSSEAYGIVQIWAATANKTFAHETGHLFGCRHDGHTGTPSYAQAKNIKLLVVVDRTMMSTNTADGSNRLVNFSNPDVNVNGRATGDSDADNARRIDETWSTVAAFRSNPPNDLFGIIEGTTSVTSPGSHTYEMVYKCSQGPYTFSWQTSPDGFNWVPASSTTDTFSYYFYNYQTLHIKCTVTSPSASYTAGYTVWAVMDEAPERPGLMNSGSSEVKIIPTESKDIDDKLSSHPNPTNGIVNIPFSVTEESQVKLQIKDSSGRLVTTILDDSRYPRNPLAIEKWDTKSVQAGVYYYYLKIGNQSKVGRILVTK